MSDKSRALLCVCRPSDCMVMNTLVGTMSEFLLLTEGLIWTPPWALIFSAGGSCHFMAAQKDLSGQNLVAAPFWNAQCRF